MNFRRASRPLLLCGIALAVSTRLAAAAPPDYSQSCSASGCHDGYAKKPFVHDPAGDNGCDVCHSVTDAKAHQFELTGEGNALCLDCHDAFEGKYPHDAVADGSCTDCHDPHASAHKGLLLRPQPELCGDCHDGVVDGLKYLHGPIAAGSCTACHSPHVGEHKALLLDEERPLCLKCHTDMGQRLTLAKHSHEALEDSCSGCHRPHSADNVMLLTGSLPGVCTECHGDIAELAADAAVKHSVVTMGKSCAHCHDAHASQHADLLLSPSGGLCLGCHNRPIDTLDGRKVADIAGEIQNREVKHGPIDDGSCDACHTAHGSKHAALSREAYPISFYAPYASEQYALCFDCHEAEAMAEAETDDATGFRNGRQNLHYLHVNKSPKGRTCRACHEVHASDRPKLIAEQVPFGAWEIPLQFQVTSTGGTCAPGCHRPYGYDREQKVENLRQPAGTN